MNDNAPSEEPLTYVCDGQRHLVCLPYSIGNLHRMAVELEIGRHWFHGGRNPHYDIPARRIDEIKSRCRVVSTWHIVAVIKGAINRV